ALWAYFGGAAVDNDPSDVWSNHYLLGEHFDEDIAAGARHVDSTGRATGELIGADLSSTVTDQGAAAKSDGSRHQYPDNIGANQRSLAVSTVYSLTPDDVPTSGTAAIVGKQYAGQPLSNSYAMVLHPDGALAASLGEDAPKVTVPADGQPHL